MADRKQNTKLRILYKSKAFYPLEEKFGYSLIHKYQMKTDYVLGNKK